MADNGEQREAGNSSGHPHQIHPFHSDVVRHPREEAHGVEPVQYTKEGHHGPDHWRVEPEATEFYRRGEEYRLQDTERYVDQREDRVAGGSDEHVSRENATQR